MNLMNGVQNLHNYENTSPIDFRLAFYRKNLQEYPNKMSKRGIRIENF